MWTEANTQNQLIEGILKHGPEILNRCLCIDDISAYLQRIDSEHLDYPKPKSSIDIKNWSIPEEYKNLNIEQFLINQCPEENLDRLLQELELYRKNEMLSMLRTMKYVVDTLRKNNIVWGVGRGSSVASYALYLIGIHKIDSVKYDLPIGEFFKEI
jgi:DNA polymerase III alpha subunit